VDAGIEIKFANGKYRFALLWPQVLELERNCGQTTSDGTRKPKSIFQIFNEMGVLSPNALDIKETLRLGLIGGNQGLVDGEEITVGALTAMQLVEDYIFPLDDSMQVAAAILHESIAGVQLKKKREAKAKQGAVKRKSKAVQNPSEKAPS
jgi:Phage tail tube protein, GTA-gp10